MIEYLYNAIRALAGQDITITAIVANEQGEPITEGCHIMLFNPDRELLATIDGTYKQDGEWDFTIPADTTEGLYGRYWYCICQHDKSLCFKEPIYLHN